jgi:hypothetical protein
MSEKETGLVHTALEAMRTGRLPDRGPDRIWGGHGSGKDNCQICGKLLNTEEITFDLEYAAAAEGAPPICYSVHLRCFNVWDIEREQSKARCATQCKPSPDQSRASLPDGDEVGTMVGSEGDILPGTRSFQPKDPG